MSRGVVTVALILAVANGCGSGENERDYVDRMAQEHRGERPVPSAAATLEPSVPVSDGRVAYARIDDREVQGYVASPRGAAPRAGLIVIHEWWGLNDNIRAMTRRLAGEGYLALAVDLYGGEVAEDAEQARTLMQTAMTAPGAVEENLRGAYAHLEAQGARRIGTIGWCFGGGWSLNTALMFPERIDATVIYYGRLETDPDRLSALRMPILGIFGENDRGIPVETVRAFESALASLGKEARIHVYPGADHAFANPSGERYRPAEAEDAWGKTVSFLAEHLRPAPAGNPGR